MEKNTQETAIALLQQSMTTLTAAMTRIELKLDKMDEASRNYITSEHIEKNYVSIEKFNSLSDRVGLLQRIIYGTLGAVLLEGLHIITQILGRK